MVIEITKRYIIGDCTLDNIIENYTDYYDEGGEFVDFSEFLACFLEDEYCDERIINGDIEPLKEICEKQSEVNKLKEKYLS